MITLAKNISICENSTIREGLEALESSRIKILLLINEEKKLTGTCTDGDFRRGILKYENTELKVSKVANMNPFTALETLNHGELSNLLKEKNLKHIPLVDKEGVLKGLYLDSNGSIANKLDVPVVLMAGGLGRRLMPYTEHMPKPMLYLDNKPILEHIIETLSKQGFRRFYISVNYLGHMIEDHFGSGKRFGVEISYLRENKRLGTGGALCLLPQNMSYPFLIMNGDLICETDFNEFIDNHLTSGAVASMCIREHSTSIPFGVVKFEGNNYIKTDEKPTLKHHINAGVYCLSLDALSVVPKNEFYDMPSLFEDLANNDHPCAVHIVRDSWIDIGTIPEFEAAKKLYKNLEN
jgi:dTDP-glucose pyrophosphorylase